MSLGKEWRTFNAVFRRNLRLFTSYSTWLIATIIWPIPLLAMNIYQYLGVASSRSVSTTLSQNYGLTLSGMIIVGTVVYLLYNRLLWSTGNSLQTERWMGTIDGRFQGSPGDRRRKTPDRLACGSGAGGSRPTSRA